MRLFFAGLTGRSAWKSTGELIASLGGVAAVNLMDHEAKAEALEHYMEDKLDEMVAAQQPEKFPTVAEIEAQIETRPHWRGAGDVFTGRGKNVKILEKMPDNRR
jgi:hypothetical protein